jgi:hypothetical protein
MRKANLLTASGVTTCSELFGERDCDLDPWGGIDTGQEGFTSLARTCIVSATTPVSKGDE